MAKRRPKKKPPQTWDGIDEGDITGTEEAAESQLIQFGKKPAQKEEQRGEVKDPSSRRAKS
jgi:hypothetical protein